ncbi:MAG: LamG domain-containing protein [Candidatus Aenigmatarchaeota archaeon]
MKHSIYINNKFIIIITNIIIEVLYFILCFENNLTIIKEILILPSLFIIPGVMFILIFNNVDNIIKLIVDGFFISNILLILLTSIAILLKINLNSIHYSFIILILVLILNIKFYFKNTKINVEKIDFIYILIFLLIYAILIIYLYPIPRLFTPDETSYLFSAKMGVLNGTVPPMGVSPDKNELSSLFFGRLFWIYLLMSFISPLDLKGYESILISIIFLTMVALASSLFIKNKILRIMTFLIIVFNPLLFSFSALILNDLAISFYIVFSIFYFIESFCVINNNMNIHIDKLFTCFLIIFMSSMIKLNILILIIFYILILYIFINYGLYKLNNKYKILLYVLFIPAILYELCIDVPYVLSVWVLRNEALGNIFKQFLLISPAEQLIGMFFSPWWDPAAKTLFKVNLSQALDYFYRLLMPESSTILVTSLVLSSPLLIISRNIRKDLDKFIINLIILMSLIIFYIIALDSMSLSDVSRLSLWMVPLWIVLTIMILEEFRQGLLRHMLVSFMVCDLLIIWINSYLSNSLGGVYVGYGFSYRIFSLDYLIITSILFIIFLGTFLLSNSLLKIKFNVFNRIKKTKIFNVKKILFWAIIILIFLNCIYYDQHFIKNSNRYDDYDFVNLSNFLLENIDKEDLVFTNNYIYLRSYIDGRILKSGLLLPPPDTEEELFKLIEVAPNNTKILISDNPDTTWYEYGNKYIKNFTYFNYLLNYNNLKYDFKLDNVILKIVIKDDKENTVIDESGFMNNISNFGAEIVNGYNYKALKFNGNEYISIKNNDLFNFKESLTISLLLKIEKIDYADTYCIISKGYGRGNGSLSVLISGKTLFFELGNVGSVYTDVSEYVGTWHHFIFTYDGTKMEIYIDGISKASKFASGAIRSSSFDLEIGRDGERKSKYFYGLIESLQISKSPLNYNDLLNSLSSYAFKFNSIQLKKGYVSLFNIINNNNYNLSINVKDIDFSLDKLTLKLKIKIYSIKQSNVYILISTDRFTKIYDQFLYPGSNELSFNFNYFLDPKSQIKSPYWLHLSQIRLIILENNKIAYNNFISIQDLNKINYIFTIILLIIIFSIIINYIFKIKYINKNYL